MAKKVEGYIKLQIEAGKATPAWTVGIKHRSVHKGLQRKNS